MSTILENKSRVLELVKLYPTLRMDVMSLHKMLGRTETRAQLSITGKYVHAISKGTFRGAV